MKHQENTPILYDFEEKGLFTAVDEPSAVNSGSTLASPPLNVLSKTAWPQPGLISEELPSCGPSTTAINTQSVI